MGKKSKVSQDETVRYDGDDGGHYHHGYHKRCYCEKFVKKYDDWKKKDVIPGSENCRRRCYTVCEYEKERSETIVYRDGHKKKFEGKWENIHECDRCGQDYDRCKCKKD